MKDKSKKSTYSTTFGVYPKFRSLSNSAGWGKYGSENKSKKTARANLPKRLLKWVQGLDLNQ